MYRQDIDSCFDYFNHPCNIHDRLRDNNGKRRFTEFYVLDPGGKAEDYPTNLKIGEEGEVIIGIVNHEYTNSSYHLEVRLNGNGTVISFLLYKGGGKEIYRLLHLWLDVKG